jgi:hypothetical protein
MRIELGDGWAVMARPWSARDYLVLRDSDIAGWLEHVDALVVDQSYGQDFLDWPFARARRLQTRWREKSAEDALPPEPGES